MVISLGAIYSFAAARVPPPPPPPPPFASLLPHPNVPLLVGWWCWGERERGEKVFEQ